METTYREISDVYDVNGVKGLSRDSMLKLPEFTVDSKIMLQISHELCCSICLQVNIHLDFKLLTKLWVLGFDCLLLSGFLGGGFCEKAS